MKLLTSLKLSGKDGQEKYISFHKDGKFNEKELLYFNTLFDCNLKLRGNFDEFSYFGAFRCGKSFSQQLAVYLICRNYSGTKALYVRDTYDQLKDSVIKQFLEEFQYLGHFVYLKSTRTCYFDNGSILVFRAFDRDTNILSSEYDVICVCQAEDIPFELFLQLFGRLSGHILPRPLLLMEGNPASGYVKERYKDQSRDSLKSKGIFFLEGQTSDNPWITQSYIQRLMDNYPRWWIDRYLYGLWDNREELVFSEFNEKKNVIDIVDPATIPKHYIKRNGFDWGWVNPFANIWGFVDGDGVLTIYDDVEQNKTIPEDVARICNKHGKILTIADHAMKGQKMPTRDDENRTVWTELEKYGMQLYPCNKEELSNIVLVNSLFKTDKLRITKNCVNLKRDIKNWKWKRLKLGTDKNMSEEPVDLNNHCGDALNYLCSDLFETAVKDPEKEKKKGTIEDLNTRRQQPYRASNLS